MSKSKRKQQPIRVEKAADSVPKEARRAGEPDWTGKCDNCGESPIVPETGLCGPCTFGEAETVGGNW